MLAAIETWWQATAELLAVGFVQHALLAAAFLGILSGALAPLVVIRQLSFAVHGTAELALMGAAAALLGGFNLGLGAILGSVVAAVVLALLGFRQQQDAAIGVVMSFGMGLSILFIHLYPGRSSTAFALLTGQIVGLSGSSVWLLALVTGLVVALVALLWRPFLFAALDPVLATTRGLNVRTLSVIFAVILGLAVAQSVQIVGALLVMALLITPGAAAVSLTARPVVAVLLATVFAELAAVGGVLVSLAPGVPVSVCVTSISFVIYLGCRLWAALRAPRNFKG